MPTMLKKYMCEMQRNSWTKYKMQWLLEMETRKWLSWVGVLAISEEREY